MAKRTLTVEIHDIQGRIWTSAPATATLGEIEKVRDLVRDLSSMAYFAIADAEGVERFFTPHGITQIALTVEDYDGDDA